MSTKNIFKKKFCLYSCVRRICAMVSTKTKTDCLELHYDKHQGSMPSVDFASSVHDSLG